MQTVSAKIALSPEMVAQWWWDSSNLVQADFFEALAKYIQKESPKAYGYGEMQWAYLRQELRRPERKLASEMFMAMSAFAFDFAQQKDYL